LRHLPKQESNFNPSSRPARIPGMGNSMETDRPMTFEEYDSGAKLNDLEYVAVVNQFGIVIGYKGALTGQRLGVWFAEVMEP